MRRDGQATALMNHFANFARGFAFQVWEFCADAEQVTVGSCDLDARQNEKAVNRLPVHAHQTFLKHVGNSVARVVICHGDAVQTFGLGGSNQIFRSRNSVSGEQRVSMEIEIKRHVSSAFCYTNSSASTSGSDAVSDSGVVWWNCKS